MLELAVSEKARVSSPDNKAGVTDTDEEGAKWVEFNGKWSQQWAVLTEKKDPMPDYEKHSGEQGRLEKYFKDK